MYLASKTPRRATNLWVASIPPTAVGGSFKLSLHRNATQKHTNTVRPSEYPRTAVGGCLQIQPTLTRCPGRSLQIIVARMHLEPLTTLNWAWQLHYYLCFRTRSRRQLFNAHEETLLKVLNEICQRHHYHVLQAKAYP